MRAFPALAATLSAVTAVLTACSAAPGGTAASSTIPGTVASGSRAPAASASRARVFGRIFDDPGVTVTAGRLYVTWRVSLATAAVPRYELARVSPLTGAIEAARLLVRGQAGAPLAAGGWLWIPIVTSAGESLLRLNPVSLAVAGDLPVDGGSRPGTGFGSHLAVAGGSLWVADGDRLLRVSLTTGQVIGTVLLLGAYTSGVAANGKGTVLVVSEADDSGIGSVQRRDPVTGTLLASHPMLGVTAPALDGVIDSGVWVSEPTGLLGYVERFRTTTMTPDPVTDMYGDNGIKGVVADGVVWITDPAAPARDYCADPVTGRVLARIPLPDPSQDRLLAISSRYVYYSAPASSGFYLKRIPVPAAC